MEHGSNRLIWIVPVLTVLVVAGVLYVVFGGGEKARDHDKDGASRISGRSISTNKDKDKAGEPKEKPSVMAELMRKMREGENGLSEEQISDFVEKNGRDARSLLVASQLTESNGRAYLDEAAEKYPNDPGVAFSMVEWARSKHPVQGNSKTAPNVKATHFYFYERQVS